MQAAPLDPSKPLKVRALLRKMEEKKDSEDAELKFHGSRLSTHMQKSGMLLEKKEIKLLKKKKRKKGVFL